MKQTVQHLTSQKVWILLFQGEKVVEKLVQAIGRKTSPSDCETNTVRRVYGNHVPIPLEEGLFYYENAAHRPMNLSEAEKDFTLFAELF